VVRLFDIRALNFRVTWLESTEGQFRSAVPSKRFGCVLVNGDWNHDQSASLAPSVSLPICRCFCPAALR
jgi:hypothetical protein